MFSEWRFFVTEFLGLVNVLKGRNVHGYEELYILHREGLPYEKVREARQEI